MPSEPNTADIPRLLVELRERGFGDAAYEIERLRGALERIAQGREARQL